MALDPTQVYPVCIGGARATPPEDGGGPLAFLALRQHFSTFHIAERLLAIVEQHADVDDPQAELETLRYWLGVDRFDRRAVNRQLRQYATELAATSPVSVEVLT